MAGCRSSVGGGRQRGAAAIEFALVFIVFFAIFYGTVSYSLPMLMLQSFNNAVAEGARQAVRVALPPGDPGYKALVENQARAVVNDQLAWLPSALSVPDDAIRSVLDVGTGVLEVTIDYPEARLANVIPSIPPLPGINDLPPVVASIKLY